MSILIKLNNFLSECATEERIETFNKVLSDRTKYITVVLEDIFQPQNASAVIRTCDCFGIQDLHIIENENEYNLNPDVVLGSAQWVDLYKYNKKSNNTKDAIDKLKKDGYRIVATTPHTDDVSLPDFDISKGKSALIFGTELTGVSDIVMENADEFLKIPMHGFTESFNISVSAAITLYQLSSNLRKSDINWNLNETEKEVLKTKWLLKSIKKSELLLKEFCLKNNLNTSTITDLLQTAP